MRYTSKQLLEKKLEEKVMKCKEENHQLTSRFERLNEFYKTRGNKGDVIGDMDFVKKQLNVIAENTPCARLLKFSKQNRYLLRSKKLNKRKLTTSPKVQFDLLMEQNYSNFRKEVRMGREAFIELYKKVKDKPEYTYKGTGRRPIPCEVQLMIALNRLGSSGTGGAYASVARRYSISGE